jgi:hypothetical protein
MSDLILREAQQSNYQRGVRAIASNLGSHVPLHLTPPVVVNEVPSGGAGKIETLVAGATFGQSSIVRLPQSISHYNGGYVLVNLAAATHRAYPGFNAIKSIRCTYAGQEVWYISNYPAALKAALKLMSVSQAEAIMSALGGAAPGTGAITVCAPLLDPWGPYLNRNGPDGLNLSKLSRGSQLHYEITWSAGAATASAGTPAISSAIIVSFYSEESASTSAADGSSLLFHGRQLMTSLDQIPGGALADFQFDVRSSIGAVDLLALFFIHSTALFTTTGISDSASSDLSVRELRTDGRSFWSTGSGSQAIHAVESAAWGVGRSEMELAAANSELVAFIPFTQTITSSSVHSFGLNTTNLNSISAIVSTTNAVAYAMVAMTSLLLTVSPHGDIVVFRA